MLHVITWWLIVQVFGAAALPLAFRLFRHLPDRGYALAKPLGLLLITYLFWLLSMLGFLRNTAGSIVFCLVAVAITSAYLYFQQRNEGPSLPSFLRTHWKVVLVTELLFLIGFAVWAMYRAYNPDISATEKPMEFAFLNGILRSERFPPLDPWLSGFAISYYYFGYVMMAVLTRLTAVPSSVAFNLGIALLFAWTLTGAFSAVYNLAAAFQRREHPEQVPTPAPGAAMGFGLLAAWVTTVAGNLEGFFEALHSRGLLPESFWHWLDVKNLAGATVTGQWYPTDNWWWWRASRVIHDRDFLGNSVEVIDEFPFFSFLLSDMHPHVLALPFVLLAVGLALNLMLGAVTAQASSGARASRPPASRWLEHLFGEAWWVFIAYALCIGAIGFLNTWDLPIYFVVMLGAYAIRRRASSPESWLTDTVVLGLLMGVLCLILYLPFYVSFQSQAGGILPNLLFSTRWQQFVLMFGLQLFMLIGLLSVRWAEVWRCVGRDRGVPAQFRLARDTVALWWGLFIGAFGVMLLFLVPLFITRHGRAFLEGVRANEAVRQVVGDLPWHELLLRLLAFRLASPWTAFAMALLLAVVVMLLLKGSGQPQADRPDPCLAQSSTTFALWLALIGLALAFSVEFVYLRDTFGTRMNTVFKFYYQAWVLLSLSGVYGLFYIFSARYRPTGQRILRVLWVAGIVVLFAISAVYPLLASYSKADGFRGPPALDGVAYMAVHRPDDYDAIRWLNENVVGAPVILEATGGSYTEYARVSSQTGLPTLLGWGGHELQWRGNYDEAGRREPDIEALYGNFDPNLTLTLLDKYGIKYVYVGYLERQKYPPAALAKFDQLLDVAYQNDGVTIYEYRPK